MPATKPFRIAFFVWGLGISWYSVFALISIILLMFVILVQAKRRGYPTKPLEYFFWTMAPAALIGARTWFLIGHWSKTVHSFWDIFAVWNGGVAIEGAAIAVTLWSFIFFWNVKRKYRVSMWKYFDIIGPNIFLLQAIGRWGNFFNQEILGPPASANKFPLSWLPSFIRNHLRLPSQGTEGAFRQPFFLYESIICLLLWLFLLFAVKGVDKTKVKQLNADVNRMQKQIMLKKIAKSAGKFTLRPKAKTGTIEKQATQYQKNIKRKSYKISVQHGNKAVLWFAFYGLIRTIMEPFRDKRDILKLGHLQLSTFTSAFFVIAALSIFCFNERIIRVRRWERIMKK